MDVYLPADFYHLRDDLPDWRDAPTVCADGEKVCNERQAHHADAENACADPLWRVF